MIQFCLCSVILPISNYIFNLQDSALVAQCTTDDKEPTEKQKICEVATTDSTPFCGTKSLPDNSQPLQTISSWVEPGMTTKQITVAFLLLRGVLSGDFSVFVSWNRCSFEINRSLPEPSINLHASHQKWMQSDCSDCIEGCHPKLKRFE